MFKTSSSFLAPYLRPFEFGISLPAQVPLPIGTEVFLPLTLRRGAKTAEGPISFNIQAPDGVDASIAVDGARIFVRLLLDEPLPIGHYLIVSALLDGQRRSARSLLMGNV